MSREPRGVNALTQALLRIERVELAYGSNVVLRDVSLEVGAGQAIAITGRSGAGKSSLLSCLVGLQRPARGRVLHCGRDLAEWGPRDLARFRREDIGIVFQFGELLPALSPLENVALPLLLSGRQWSVASKRAEDLLRQLGVPNFDGPSAVLSGGERQRCSLARAIVAEPQLVVADEPTGSLDAVTRDEIAEILFSLPATTGCGLLVVTHDPAIAARADQAWALVDGVLTEGTVSHA